MHAPSPDPVATTALHTAGIFLFIGAGSARVPSSLGPTFWRSDLFSSRVRRLKCGLVLGLMILRRGRRPSRDPNTRVATPISLSIPQILEAKILRKCYIIRDVRYRFRTPVLHSPRRCILMAE